MSAMPFTDLRPTVVMADSSPLIHLAAVGQLDLLFEYGHVVLADVVGLETSLDRSKPFAPEVSSWIEANRGSRPSLVDTDLGPVYEFAIKSGARPPRNSGERAIVDWLIDNIVHEGGPLLIIYENGRIPNMLRREGLPDDVVVMASRYFLRLSQERRRGGGLAQDRLARQPLQPAGRSHAGSAEHLMDDRLTSILRRYSRGEISAERAADEMGTTYNVGDVYVLLREAGLPLPNPDGPFERAQFERAKRLFANVS